MPAVEQTDSSLSSLSTVPFQNEPLLSFGDDRHADAMRHALVRTRAQLGREYPLIIGGKQFRTSPNLVSTNPARPSEIVGIHHSAGSAEVNQAVRAARDAFESWQSTSADDRAGLLLAVAGVLRRRKYEFCAWLTYETGKNWAEADAEVAEAIDFLEYYAREAMRLALSAPPVQLPGESGELLHIPLGPGAVIPPWNFPLAILAGMTCAAIVCGNTVVLKPSPDAPTIAAIFCGVLEDCGLPPGVVNLCQGGAEAGQALVEHPAIRFVAFTGSKKAGLDIHLRAAHVRPGQIFIKRTILEMGGKDAIIIDRDADIESALRGVVASAFGYNGQKCSACSRLIVDDAVYEEVAGKLVDRVAALRSGDPAENFALGPVINRAAYDRVLRYFETGRQEGSLLTGGNALTPPDAGYFLAPTIFGEVAPGARLGQDEIFGPLLAVMRARDFDDALEIANRTEYGLTGSVYTANRKKIDRARRRFHVGNLYINRKCTGAMVGAHPFGGFNMSGTDSKAGGPDYLTLFTQGKSIAELLTLPEMS
jgi:1-pyrroline-5-carboxylate dehydrogenase